MAKAEYKSAIRSRKLICEAMIDLLTEKPLDKITVTDIVRRAELNRGTFYAHYTDISDVINHLIQQTFSRISEALSKEYHSIEDIPRVLLNQVQSILEEDIDFYKKVMTSSTASLMREQLVNAVLEYFLENESNFNFGSHEQYVFTIRFGAGGLSSLYTDWFAGNLPTSLSELTKRGTDMLNAIIAMG